MNFIEYCTNMAQVIFTIFTTFCVTVVGMIFMLYEGLCGKNVNEIRDDVIKLIGGE